MRLSAKGVDGSAVAVDLRHWYDARQGRDSGRRGVSRREQRRLKHQATFRREHATEAEQALSVALSAGKLFGTNWRRQHIVDDLIVDLYCATARLIVEIHPDGRKWSRQDDVDYLISQGFAVLRFSESDVLERLEWVLELIRGVCHRRLRMATRRGKAVKAAEKPNEKSVKSAESAARTAESAARTAESAARTAKSAARTAESAARTALQPLPGSAPPAPIRMGWRWASELLSRIWRAGLRLAGGRRLLAMASRRLNATISLPSSFDDAATSPPAVGVTAPQGNPFDHGAPEQYFVAARPPRTPNESSHEGRTEARPCDVVHRGATPQRSSTARSSGAPPNTSNSNRTARISLEIAISSEVRCASPGSG